MKFPEFLRLQCRINGRAILKYWHIGLLTTEMDSLENPRNNHVLAALPDVVWKRLSSHFERVKMPLG